MSRRTYPMRPLKGDPIVKYPDSILRMACSPIKEVTQEVKSFAQQLLIVCKALEGMGLSAPQVGKTVCIIVVDTKLCPLVQEFGYDPGDTSPTPVEKSYRRERHPYLINPVISNQSTEMSKYKEGCLSLPGIHGYVNRPIKLDITFQGLDGKTYTEHIEDTTKDIYGIIVQHEVDHLDGKLFIDKMDKYDYDKIINKVNKLRRK